MSDCSPKQLCFPPIAGHTIRADFEGGALSSDFGTLLLRGIDRQVGLTERLAYGTCWPSASIKSPRGMQTPMTPIISAETPCSNSGWSGRPWIRLTI